MPSYPIIKQRRWRNVNQMQLQHFLVDTDTGAVLRLVTQIQLIKYSGTVNLRLRYLLSSLISPFITLIAAITAAPVIHSNLSSSSHSLPGNQPWPASPETDLGDLAWPTTLFYAAPAWLSGSVRRETSATSLSSNIFWSKYFSSRREIPAGNYQMHVVHCARNIALCKHCDEPVPRGELEDHIREFHSKVDCVCGEKIDKPKLEYHKVMKEIVLEIQIILSAGERVFQENNSLQVLCHSCWDGEPWRTWELLWQQDWEVWEGI